MAPSKVTKPARNIAIDLNEEGANALLAATFTFLRRNNISTKSMLEFARKYCNHGQRARSLRLYRQLEKAQEDMGTILATWFTNAKFLDPSGNPLPLSIGKGPHSMAQLIRAAGVRIQPPVVARLMRQSPSFKLNSDGDLIALRRLFVLPGLEVFRVAFVVERYLETVLQITNGRQNDTPMLFERSCYVSEIDLANMTALIRDIRSRTTAFMDSIDGELEGRRRRGSKRKNIGELGVHVFAWTKPSTNASRRK